VTGVEGEIALRFQLFLDHCSDPAGRDQVGLHQELIGLYTSVKQKGARHAAYLHLSVCLVLLGRIPKSHIDRREIPDIVPDMWPETSEIVVLSVMSAQEDSRLLGLTP
jgi:hypothetical protein